jgi:flavin reductase (DIM6/NTAB) family NADH-FMN oxidoreductase RutF
MPPIGLWEGIHVRSGEGPPLLEGAVGWITCARAGEHPTGDHTLFVGQITSVEPGPGRDALVYLRQGYAAV